MSQIDAAVAAAKSAKKCQSQDYWRIRGFFLLLPKSSGWKNSEIERKIDVRVIMSDFFVIKLLLMSS